MTAMVIYCPQHRPPAYPTEILAGVHNTTRGFREPLAYTEDPRTAGNICTSSYTSGVHILIKRTTEIMSVICGGPCYKSSFASIPTSDCRIISCSVTIKQ